MATEVALAAVLPQPWGSTVAGVVFGVLLECVLVGVIDAIPLAYRTSRCRRPMKQWTEQVRRQAGRAVVGGSWFGASPRGSGSGTALMIYLRAEHGGDGPALVAMARSLRVAKVYVAHGARASDTDPRLIAWW